MAEIVHKHYSLSVQNKTY